jgi:hypothetical protein
MLTALAAILALIPLAIGFNINFVTLFSHLNPHIFFGGDSTQFWKPLSWTIIFGLAFAFFMTLVIVPSMYLIAERLKRPMRRQFGGKWISMMGIPPLTFIFMPLMLVTSAIHSVGVTRRVYKLNNEEIPKSPKSVTNSINLIKLSLIISVISTIVQVILKTLELNIGMTIILLLVWGLLILIIYGLANQQSWARTLFLILTIIGTLTSLFSLPILLKTNFLGAVLGIIITIVQIIALLLLYSKDSRSWFNRNKNKVIGSMKANEKFIGSWF